MDPNNVINKVSLFVAYVNEWGSYLSEYDREKLFQCLMSMLEKEVFKLNKIKDVNN